MKTLKHRIADNSVADAVMNRLGKGIPWWPYYLHRFRLHPRGVMYHWSGVAVDPGARVQNYLLRQCS